MRFAVNMVAPPNRGLSILEGTLLSRRSSTILFLLELLLLQIKKKLMLILKWDYFGLILLANVDEEEGNDEAQKAQQRAQHRSQKSGPAVGLFGTAAQTHGLREAHCDWHRRLKNSVFNSTIF
jgi:tRNA G37 N-methylase Trm5